VETPETPAEDAGTRADGDVGTDLGGQADGADVQAYTLTVDQAAEILGKSGDTVRRYIRGGQLPAMRVQGERTVEYRLRTDDVLDLHGRMHAYVGADVSRQTGSAHVPTSEERDEGTQARVQDDASVTRLGAAAAMQSMIEQVVAPLAAANEQLRAQGERQQETIRQQAEELGAARERARQAQGEAEQARAQLQAYMLPAQEQKRAEAHAQATAMLAQIRVRSRNKWRALHRPWWAFWRPGPPRRDGQDDQ